MHVDILIVGAGLAGSSLATALRTSPYKIGLLESRLPPSVSILQDNLWDQRVYAISPSSAYFLKKLGIWQKIDLSRITPVYDMEIFGDLGARLDFSAYQTGVSELAWIVEGNQLQSALWESLQSQENLSLICPASPTSLSIEPESARLSLSDGRTITANLVIAADGAHSWVRQALGVASNTKDYGEQGIVANFNCEKPHHNTAFQWFRSDGALAYLPLSDDTISIVWSTPSDHARSLLALEPGALCHRVTEAGQHKLGHLQLLSAPAAFPLRLMRPSRTVGTRFALIGDAAHTIHPLSGHGVNLGFSDARCLAKILQTAHTQDPLKDCGHEIILRRYERARAEEVKLMQWATNGLHSLFRAQGTPAALFRNLGFKLINRLSPVRNILVRYVLGHPDVTASSNKEY